MMAINAKSKGGREFVKRFGFIDVFTFGSFGFPFRVMFVVRHLFPEIRDEVPENFQRTEFLIRLRQGSVARGETGRGLPALRHGAFALAQGSSGTRRRGRQRMPRMGGIVGHALRLPGDLGKRHELHEWSRTSTTLQSIGFGQFVRICERSRWDRRHRRQSRDGKRRASREASEFQIRVVD